MKRSSLPRVDTTSLWTLGMKTASVVLPLNLPRICPPSTGSPTTCQSRQGSMKKAELRSMDLLNSPLPSEKGIKVWVLFLFVKAIWKFLHIPKHDLDPLDMPQSPQNADYLIFVTQQVVSPVSILCAITSYHPTHLITWLLSHCSPRSGHVSECRTDSCHWPSTPNAYGIKYQYNTFFCFFFSF